MTTDCEDCLATKAATPADCEDCQAPINTDPRYSRCDCDGMRDMLEAGLRMSGTQGRD